MNKNFRWISIKKKLPLLAIDVEVKCYGEICPAYYYNNVWHIDDAPDPDWGITHWRYIR